MPEKTQLTYDDLPPEAVKAAQSMFRGVFYNQEDDAPYDEELLAKNMTLFVLSAAGWEPES